MKRSGDLRGARFVRFHMIRPLLSWGVSQLPTLGDDHVLLRISTAQRLAAILWPEFVERDGAILAAFVKASPAPGEFETWTEYERFHSHTHIQDVFRCDVPDRHDAALGLHRPDAETLALLTSLCELRPGARCLAGTVIGQHHRARGLAAQRSARR